MVWAWLFNICIAPVSTRARVGRGKANSTHRVPGIHLIEHGIPLLSLEAYQRTANTLYRQFRPISEGIRPIRTQFILRTK